MPHLKIILAEKFKKEFAKYLKKYRTLEDDFQKLVDVISVFPTGNESKHWNILKHQDEKYILKTRMMCRAVKGSSFRVIYYYDGEIIELVFIEIYFKGKKESEDTKRIEEFWQQKNRA